MATGAADLDFFRPGPQFAEAPNVSVDRPVIEKTRNATVVPMDVAWSDVGSWQALHELAATDDSGDALHRDVLPLRTTNSARALPTGHLVAMLGVEGLIVAETADAVLVADRHEAERVGEVATRNAQCGRPEHRTHRGVYGPWGHFETVETGPGYRVKRITVNPGARLSLQMHRERSE